MELTNVAVQTVGIGQNVLFNEEPIKGSKCIQHRDGSGLVTLRGLTRNQCKARFLIEFNGNIAINAEGTAGEEISVAIAISGEPLLSSLSAATTAVVDRYFNVTSVAYVDVPAGCCATISVENTSDTIIDVRNANLIVTRVA